MTQNGSILGHFGSFLAIFGDPQISPFWPKPHGSSLLLGLPGQKGSKSGQVLDPPGDPPLFNRGVPRDPKWVDLGHIWTLPGGSPV
jgi:hypothetical protein